MHWLTDWCDYSACAAHQLNGEREINGAYNYSFSDPALQYHLLDPPIYCHDWQWHTFLPTLQYFNMHEWYMSDRLAMCAWCNYYTWLLSKGPILYCHPMVIIIITTIIFRYHNNCNYLPNKLCIWTSQRGQIQITWKYFSVTLSCLSVSSPVLFVNWRGYFITVKYIWDKWDWRI